tara:strand:+ start:80 stop:1516 length:1437 start_codon:yes stop_codon:yes gene_type:complete
MKNIFLFFLFPLLVLGQNKKTIKYFNAGEKAQDEKNHIEAINQFKLAIKKYPKYYEAYNEIGNSFRALNNLDSALFYHSKSVNLNTEYPDGYWSKAMTYIYLKEYEKSITNFTKYIELVRDKYPENFYGYFKRGNIKSLLTDHNDAIFDYTMALRLDSVNISTDVVNKTGLYIVNSIDAYISRGQEYNSLANRFDLENYQNAKKDIKKALKLATIDGKLLQDYNWIYSSYGNVFWNEAEHNPIMYDSALFYYKRHIETDTTDFYIHYIAGECLRLMNRPKEAIYYYKFSLDSLPDYIPETISDRILECYEVLNDNERALEFLDYLIVDFFRNNNSVLPIIYSKRGIKKHELKDFEGSIEDHTKALDLDPNYKNAYYNRGISKSDLKDYRGAIVDYTKAIELDSSYTNAYYNRGISNYNLKDYEGSIRDNTITIELQPDYINAYINRGVSKSKINLDQCVDYKKACALGDCDYFNKYCK